MFERMAVGGVGVLPEAAVAAARNGSDVVRRGLEQSMQMEAVGVAFPSPEEHAAPKDVTTQPGWMQGAAGIASFLLQVHARAHDGRGARPQWPDEPVWGSVTAA